MDKCRFEREFLRVFLLYIFHVVVAVQRYGYICKLFLLLTRDLGKIHIMLNAHTPCFLTSVLQFQRNDKRSCLKLLTPPCTLWHHKEHWLLPGTSSRSLMALPGRASFCCGSLNWLLSPKYQKKTWYTTFRSWLMQRSSWSAGRTIKVWKSVQQGNVWNPQSLTMCSFFFHCVLQEEFSIYPFG